MGKISFTTEFVGSEALQAIAPHGQDMQRDGRCLMSLPASERPWATVLKTIVRTSWANSFYVRLYLFDLAVPCSYYHPPGPSPHPQRRTTHPTELIRPRKQFKVQQARIAAEARSDANASSSKSSSKGAAPRSSFSTGRSSTSGGGRGSGCGAPRRMLCQPTQSLEDDKRGLYGVRGEEGGGWEAGSQEEGNGESDVRRSRRARRQVHPSLSEDTMAAANGYYNNSSDEDSDEDGEGSGDDACGDTTLNLRMSEAAPWGEGNRPLIKVSAGRV